MKEKEHLRVAAKRNPFSDARHDCGSRGWGFAIPEQVEAIGSTAGLVRVARARHAAVRRRRVGYAS
jgi:hypothetical protein